MKKALATTLGAVVAVILGAFPVSADPVGDAQGSAASREAAQTVSTFQAGGRYCVPAGGAQLCTYALERAT